MKTLFGGIALIIVLGIGGFIYRNALEHPSRTIACPLDAQLCPDGTAVTRTGLSCTFPACPPPNVTLADLGISFALPATLQDAPLADSSAQFNYDLVTNASSTASGSVYIYRYPIAASSTALATIQQTAITTPSGLPARATALTSTALGNYRFTVVGIERNEGVLITAYYLARATDVLRFDAVDTDVRNWTDPQLDPTTLPAHQALRALLSTLQGQ
ncbi:MAG: hypothetical protein AAB442_01310 [Patescibacteria group bacterium]